MDCFLLESGSSGAQDSWQEVTFVHAIACKGAGLRNGGLRH